MKEESLASSIIKNVLDYNYINCRFSRYKYCLDMVLFMIVSIAVKDKPSIAGLLNKKINFFFKWECSQEVRQGSATAWARLQNSPLPPICILIPIML